MESFAAIFEELAVKFLTLLPKAIVAMVILIIGVYLAGLTSKLVRKAMEKRGVDLEVNMVITNITRWSIIALSIFVGLQQMGFDLSAF